MRRILALDGGGIRGVFVLEILQRIQDLLRAHYSSPDLLLSDHFDFFAGTSTGAIIATCLCWGLSVQDILEMYLKFGEAMFRRTPWYLPKRYFISRYDARPLSAILQRLFSEDGEGKVPALLDSPRLRKLLLVVVRNHTTGSAWPITNNPNAMFNDPSMPGSNLKIPLWKVVRASTAAPVYFDPERIEIDGVPHVFVDGSITPYNNPAMIAALTATLPCYRVNWEAGPERIRLISIGSMRFSSSLPKEVKKLWVGYHAASIPPALIQGIAWEQDYLCRCLGRCIYGEDLDLEIGGLNDGKTPGSPWFSYVRYNQTYSGELTAELLRKHPGMARPDALAAIPFLREAGRTYAEEHVRLEHLI